MRSLEESHPETESGWWAPGAGRGNAELVFHGDTASVWKGEEVLEMDGGDGGTTLHLLNATELQTKK